ncbi:WD40/PQQ-like beta propeller repeat containing protein [Halapricum desulfuricans]|uniref:WD40/PQQ-like beta propeller repeat containing protein n=1 Tax=Halapricum desulfuricans TaxID=2841257 RepID=A0A897MXT6_9EURY|nr:WD40/PQQ-like beta propeller repeat containing protein [Halapricum desulfuricans]
MIAGGRVAVVVSEMSSERILTVDLASGEEQWTELVTTDGHMGQVDDMGDLVASEGDLFYRTHTEDHGLAVAAMSLGTGKRLWVTPVDGGGYGRPAVTGRGNVWIHERDDETDESIVTALSADSGDECSSWRVDSPRPNEIYVHDESLYVSTAEGIVALDRDTGDEQWRTEESARLQAVTENRVFATNHPGFLIAYQTGSGDEEWTVESDHYMDGERIPDDPGFKRSESGNSVARPNYGELAIVGDLMLARERVHSSHSDRITAFEIETGDEVWQVVPEELSDDDTTVTYTGPVIAGQVAFACENRRDGESRLLRIDVSTGEILASVEMATIATGSPSVGRGAVVIPQEDGIICYADD